MAGIDQADLPSVLIVDDGVGQHTEIRTVHGCQFIICDFPAMIQLRLYLDEDEHRRAYPCDAADGQDG